MSRINFQKIRGSKLLVVDTETNGLRPSDGARIFKVGMENEDGVVVIAERDGPGWKTARKVVEDPGIAKVCHNVKFDLRMFRHEGWNAKGVWHDTMFMAHTINEYEPRINLEFLSKKYLPNIFKDPSIIKEQLKKDKRANRKNEIFKEPTYEDIDPDILDEYLETDLDCTLQLYWMYSKPVFEQFREVYDWERRLAPCVAMMEDIGVRIDLEYCRAKIRRLHPQLNKLENKIHKLANKQFNVNSPIQLLEALRDNDINPTDTKKETLEEFKLNHPKAKTKLIENILEYRKYHKMLGTFLIPLVQLANDDILHCSFWQLGEDEGIKTARFSSSKPNLQNQPKRDSLMVRRAFIPREGYVFVFIDYSQIEARIFAHYANDKIMLKAFKKEEDVYVTDMQRIWVKEFKTFKGDVFKKKRFEAKTIRLALQYGMGVAKLARKLEWTVQQAKIFKRQYLIQFPTVAKLLKDAQNELFRNGYVEDVFGRRYRVPIKLSYKAINAKIQGTAAQVMKRGMVRIWEGPCQTEDLRMLITVHDELIFEMREKDMKRLIPKLVNLMEDHDNFKIPMTVDVEWSDKSWADKKDWR